MFCNIGNVSVSGCRDIDVMYKYPIGLTDKRLQVIKKMSAVFFFYSCRVWTDSGRQTRTKPCCCASDEGGIRRAGITGNLCSPVIFVLHHLLNQLFGPADAGTDSVEGKACLFRYVLI